jgi:hypothetical protein
LALALLARANQVAGEYVIAYDLATILCWAKTQSAPCDYWCFGVAEMNAAVGRRIAYYAAKVERFWPIHAVSMCVGKPLIIAFKKH